MPTLKAAMKNKVSVAKKDFIKLQRKTLKAVNTPNSRGVRRTWGYSTHFLLCITLNEGIYS